MYAEPTVVLRRENPFFDLFPNGIVPVTAGAPMRISLEDDPEMIGYMLDGARLDTETMQAIAERMAELRGGRVSDIRDELLRSGVPIRFSQVAPSPYL